MGPRANFECRTCQVTYEDLPVAAVRCPVCSHKRGFRRLFDAVQVAGGEQRAKSAIVDTVVGPEYERQAAIKANSAAIQAKAPSRPMTPQQAEAFRAVGAAGGNAHVSVPVLRGLSGRMPKPDWYRP